MRKFLASSNGNDKIAGRGGGAGSGLRTRGRLSSSGTGFTLRLADLRFLGSESSVLPSAFAMLDFFALLDVDVGISALTRLSGFAIASVAA